MSTRRVDISVAGPARLPAWKQSRGVRNERSVTRVSLPCAPIWGCSCAELGLFDSKQAQGSWGCRVLSALEADAVDDRGTPAAA